ncbi:hypothetical protein EV360DRAFT_86607 [Lentinula raphanica]|nr:hypothetical protein EV360DRAFT_86607 [Lentinula raphanica]
MLNAHLCALPIQFARSHNPIIDAGRFLNTLNSSIVFLQSFFVYEQTEPYAAPKIETKSLKTSGRSNEGSINNCAEDTEPTMAISRMVLKYSQSLNPPIQTVPNGTHSHIH